MGPKAQEPSRVGFLEPVVQIPCQTWLLSTHSHPLGPHTQGSPQPQHNPRTHPQVLWFGSELFPKGHVAKSTSLPTCSISGTGVVGGGWSRRRKWVTEEWACSQPLPSISHLSCSPLLPGSHGGASCSCFPP